MATATRNEGKASAASRNKENGQCVRTAIPATSPTVGVDQGAPWSGEVLPLEPVEEYRRWRPMVERSIAWLVADNHRRVRYRGVPKNQLGLSLRIAALNLRRLVNLGLDHNGSAWGLA